MCPAFVVSRFKIEQELVSVTITQKIRMVTERFFRRRITTETFISLIIVIEDLGTGPVMTFDTEVIVCLNCKLRKAISGLKESLSQSNAGRHTAAVHFLDCKR